VQLNDFFKHVSLFGLIWEFRVAVRPLANAGAKTEAGTMTVTERPSPSSSGLKRAGAWRTLIFELNHGLPFSAEHLVLSGFPVVMMATLSAFTTIFQIILL
jgi:hypothetical protein